MPVGKKSFLLNVISGKSRFWLAPLLRCAFWAMVPFYWFAWKISSGRRKKNTVSVAVPLISVGNITTGGTGKTPLVQWIVARLLEKKVTPAILSRGYGTSTENNDEFRELQLKFPRVLHRQQPNRVVAAQEMVESGAVDVLVLDDGFQYRQLFRTLDIVVVDATLPFGFGYLLPRGLLREPLNELKRADLVVINRSSLVERQQLRDIFARIRQYTDCPIAVTNVIPLCLKQRHAEDLPIEAIRSEKVGLFAAIGNPENFLETIVKTGATVSKTCWFDDHHEYQQQDVSRVCRECDDVDIVVCTMKDFVKLDGLDFGAKRVLAVEVGVQTVGQELENAIDQVVTEVTCS